MENGGPAAQSPVKGRPAGGRPTPPIEAAKVAAVAGGHPGRAAALEAAAVQCVREGDRDKACRLLWGAARAYADENACRSLAGCLHRLHAMLPGARGEAEVGDDGREGPESEVKAGVSQMKTRVDQAVGANMYDDNTPQPSAEEARLRVETALALARLYRPFAVPKALMWYDVVLQACELSPHCLDALDALLETDALDEALSFARAALLTDTTDATDMTGSTDMTDARGIAFHAIPLPSAAGQASGLGEIAPVIGESAADGNTTAREVTAAAARSELLRRVRSVTTELLSYLPVGRRRCSLLCLHAVTHKAASIGYAKAVAQLGDALAAIGEAWAHPHCLLRSAQAMLCARPRRQVAGWLLEALVEALYARDHVLCHRLEATADVARRLWGDAPALESSALCSACDTRHEAFPEELQFVVEASMAWRTADHTALAALQGTAHRLTLAPTCPECKIQGVRLLGMLRGRPGLG